MTINEIKSNVTSELMEQASSLPDFIREDAMDAIRSIESREYENYSQLLEDEEYVQSVIADCYFTAIMSKVGSIQSKCGQIKG